MNQYTRQAQPLLHAAGQAVDGGALLGLQVGQFEHAFDDGLALFSFYAESRSEELEVLEHLQVIIDSHEIRHVPDQPTDFLAVFGDVKLVDKGSAPAGSEQGQHFTLPFNGDLLLLGFHSY